jgi:NAD(P)-dependent dehydrogenase (short-subunit alcohol dehydrogenase family)
MMLENKVAVVYGAGVAIGSAVARAFASEGAKLFLSGATWHPRRRPVRSAVAASTPSNSERRAFRPQLKRGSLGGWRQFVYAMDSDPL